MLCCPGLCCAFWPVLLGLSDAERRLGELADEIEEERVPITEVLSKYGRLENHISATTKAAQMAFGCWTQVLYSTVMWLLLACLLYALMLETQ